MKMSSSKMKETSELLNLIERAVLPELVQEEEQPISDRDFSQHKLASLPLLENILQRVKILSSDKNSSVLNATTIKSFLVPLLLLCGEHTESSVWSSARHISLAFQLLSELKTLTEFASIQDILISTHDCLSSGQVLKWCLESLGVRLFNPDWKKHPGAQTCFIWLLHQLVFPNLTSSVISDALSTCLRFLDDWEMTNKLKGIRSLRHVIHNCNVSEMKWLGRVELIEDALTKSLYSRLVAFSVLYIFFRKY